MVRRERPEADEGMPRWVKIFLIVGLALAVLIPVAVLAGHGPGRHLGHAAVPGAAIGGRG
ncbi:hypothetical protein AB0G04_18665 [Actinoplanes sp. NPDC023801]|uniref:hypothetical protein n=1 Tax=Actinoplanes sp. NPDC023801 TaxID=3154595 RepID=UPI003404B1B0